MPSPKEVLEYAMLSPSMGKAALDGVVANNMDKNFIQRIKTMNPSVSASMPLPNGQRATHLMSSGDGYVFPSISYQNQQFVKNRPALNDDINMGSDVVAEWFANNYKKTNPIGFGLKE